MQRSRHESPLQTRHEAAAAEAAAAALPARSARGAPSGSATSPAPELPPAVTWLAYAPPSSGELPSLTPPECEIVASYGAVELEYAAIRRAAGLFDAAHRGTLRITGAERRDFLNRMVTQDLRTLAPGRCAAAFWLNRKGRIDADLLLCETEQALWVDVDVHLAAATVASLSSFIFSEDVEIADVTAEMHRLWLHGPAAVAALAAAAGRELALGPLEAAPLSLAGAEIVAARRDLVGEPGIELFVPRGDAAAVWDALTRTEGAEAATASSAVAGSGAGRRSAVRPIGWHAFNIGRIEAGSPLFLVDFDTTCLPHETGLLGERVSFVKGCYLGQEIVARMESRGRPKRLLVGLRVEGPVLPEAGSPVYEAEGGQIGAPVGVITSSTISPMLGAAPIAFAMVRIDFAAPGRQVLVLAENQRASATIGGLRFWGRP